MVLEILKKILDFGIFSEILNFLKILKIMSYNFQSRKQILTLRGVYFRIMMKNTWDIQRKMLSSRRMNVAWEKNNRNNKRKVQPTM